MKKYNITKGFFLLFVICLTTFTYYLVEAQNISVQPMRIEVSLAAGESATKTIELFNQTQKKLTVSLTKVDFDMRKDGTVNVLNHNTTANSLSRWFKLPKNNIIMEPKEKKKILLKISHPNDSSIRSKWGGIMVRTNNFIETKTIEKDTREINLRLINIVAVLNNPPISLEKKGKITSLQVEVISSDHNKVQESKIESNTLANSKEVELKQVSIDSTFTSTCKKILKVNGYLEIRNQEGQVINKKKIKDKVILPFYDRVFTASFPTKALKPGEYVALVVIDYGGKSLVGGQKSFKLSKNKFERNNS